MKPSNWAIAGTALLVGACASVSTTEDTQLLARAQQLFKPLPVDASTPERPLTPEKIELGLPDSAWVFVTLEIELAVTIGGVMREIGS